MKREKYKSISSHLDPETYAILEQIAKEEGVSLYRAIQVLLSRGIEDYKKNPPRVEISEGKEEV